MIALSNGVLALLIPLISTAAVSDDPVSVPQPQVQASKPQQEKPKERDPINPDRPGIADGSMVVGRGVFQIELGGQYENHDQGGGGHQRLLFTPALFRYGLDNRSELRIETLGFNEVWQTGQSAMGGYAPMSLGAKWQFQQPSDKNGQLSLGTIARVFAPSGSAGFQTEHATGDLRLAADWVVAPHWYLNPNFGFGCYESGGSQFTALLGAMTLSRDLDSKTQVFIDGGVQAPEEWGGLTGTILDFGITFVPSNDVQLDVSVGTGVSGHTTPHPFLGIGYSIRF